MKKVNVAFYFFSLLVHLFILGLATISFQFSNERFLIGNKEFPSIETFVSTEKQSISKPKPQAEATQKKVPIVTQKKADITLSRPLEVTPKKPQPIKQKPSPTNSANASKGIPTEKLLALLHAAIQKKQHYPESAQAMAREGRATITFTLFKSGTVSNVHLTKSSGTQSLDQAAINAVKDAAPFTDLEHYLTQNKDYSIDVVFELS